MDESHGLRGWSAITGLIVWVLLIEAVFAGAMLSGVTWARAAHSATAAALILATFTIGIIAVITRRRIPHGLRLGLTLLALAGAIFVQAIVGALSARGANLLWLHVPLGVAVFGFGVRAARLARRP
jgi:hypothetical protein